MMSTPESSVAFQRPNYIDQFPHFAAKLVADSRALVFDMTGVLPAGIVLASATVKVSCSSFVDTAPQNIINGDIAIDVEAELVTVPVTAGVSGCFYIIEIDCVTNSLFYNPVMIAVLPVL